MEQGRARNIKGLTGWAALLLLVALTAWLSWTLQAPITLQGGYGWDGVEYGRVAAQLAAGGRPRAEAPYLYRLGAPALAGWLSPADPLAGFRLVSGAAALLAPLLLYLWLGGFGLSAWSRWLGTALFALQWHAPLRLTPFYAAHADPLMWVFWLGGLLLLQRSRRGEGPGLLAIWCGWILLALPCREVLLLPALALLFTTDPLLLLWQPWPAWRAQLQERLRPVLLLPLALGLLVFLLIHAWAVPTNSYGFLKTAVLWCWLKSVPHYLHGLCQALGPGVLILLLLGRHEARAWLAGRQELLALLVGVLMLGWVGGSDTERILYWGAPIFYLLAGFTLDRLPAQERGRRRGLALWLSFLTLTQALSQRLLWTIPDFPGTARRVWPLLTPPSATGRYLDLWSYHGDPKVLALSFAQYLLVIGAGWWWGRRLLRRGSTSRRISPHPTPSSSGAAPRD